MNNYRSKKAEKNIISTYDRLLKEWGIQVEEMDLSTRFGVTHVIAAGENTARPLILLHGVGDDSALMWIYNAKALAQHFKIYAVDSIGGPGKSKMGRGYNKNFDEILWMEEVMKKLNLSKASFVGVSHGGYLVQLFALKRTDKVDKAISISSSVPCGKRNGSLRMMMKIFFPEALFPTPRNTVKLIEKLSGDNSKVFTENKLIMEHYHWLLKGFNKMGMRYYNVAPFTEEQIALLKDRVHYLVGERDLFEKFGGKEALVQHKMNAHFYLTAGHGLNHEESDEVNKMIIDIIEGRIHNVRTEGNA